MDRTSSKTKSFKRHGITILVLLFVFSAYFAVHVPRRTDYFTERYFRLLADTGDQLNEVVVNLATGLANATSRPTNATAAVDRPTGSLARRLRGNEGQMPEITPGEIRAAVKLIPNLSLVGEPITNHAPPLIGLRLSVGGGIKTPSLRWDFTNLNVRVQARSDLNRLLEPIVNRSEFDDVLLLNPNKDVVYQLGSSSLRVTHLDVPGGASFETNLVSFSGGDYRLFSQPIQIAVPAGEEADLKWVLCGLVNADRFQSQTWAVDYRVVVVFISLALLLVVSWPLLNVWSMGLKGGLRVAETFLLAFSALLVTALLTLLLLDRIAYANLKRDGDRQLAAFAGSISTNLAMELERVSEQLERFNIYVLRTSRDGNRTNALADVEVMGPDLAAAPYPWFHMAFWADANGKQDLKWTVKSETTPMINVGTRSYFRTIAEDRAWTLGPRESPVRFCLEPVYSRNTGENLAIYSTAMPEYPGEVAAVDLRLLSLVNPVLPEGYGFAVIGAAGEVLFHADEKRNLRENFFEECGGHPRLRAAVYGRATDQFDAPYFRRPHRMSILPLANLPWSLVVFRDEARLQIAQIEMVSIAGLLFLFYAGLWLVVVSLVCVAGRARWLNWLWPQHDSAGPYRLVTEGNIVLAAAGGALALLNLEPRLTLMLGFFLPAAAVVFAGAALTPRRSGPDWLKVPFLFRKLAFDDQRGYVAAMGSLLILLAVVPVLAFFRVSFDKEMELVVKQTQLELAKDFQARVERVRTEVLGTRGSGNARVSPLVVPDPTHFIELRLSNRWDVYDDFFYATTTALLPARNGPATSSAGESAVRSWFNDWLGKFRPHYHKLDVEPRGLLEDTTGDSSWQWRRESPGLALYKSAFPSADGETRFTLRIASRRPGLGAPGPLATLGILVLLGLPFLLLYTVADKVLLLHVLKSRHDASQAWPPGKYLVLGPPGAKKSALLDKKYFAALNLEKPPPIPPIDLRTDEGRKWLDISKQDALFKDTNAPIVVDHFEYNLTDPVFNQMKFRFLQHFAHDEKRPVIVVSNVHPLNFPVAAGPKESKAASLKAKQGRAELLAAFRKIYRDDERNKPLTPMPADKTTHEKHAHYRSVWATCSPKEQEILHQVAQGRLISSDQFEIRTLLDRGLLVREPALRLMNDAALRRFILSHYRPEPDEEEETESWWQSIKGPAITTLIIVAGFIFITQRAVWNYTIGLVPAFLAGLGAFMQVINLFQKRKLAKLSQEEQA